MKYLLTALIEKKIGIKLLMPKNNGSTATISRAEQQVKNLYGVNVKYFLLNQIN